MSALGRQRRGCTPDAELWMRHPCIIHPLSGRDLASRSWEPVTTFPLFTEAKRGIKSKWWIKARLHVVSTGNRTNTVHALPKRNEASTLTDGRGVNGQPAWNRWVWNAEMKSPKIYHAMLRSFLCPFKCKRDWKRGSQRRWEGRTVALGLQRVPRILSQAHGYKQNKCRKNKLS